MKYVSLLVVFTLFFSGCFSKQYFEPKHTKWSLNKKIITTPSYIQMKNANGATLEDRRILNKFGVSEFVLPDGYEFLNYTSNDIIAANNQGKLLFVGEKMSLDLGNNIIAATRQGNLLAIVFADNTIALYDLKLKQYKFKNYLKKVFVNDIRIASPIFFKNLILFPTLDGKVLVVNNKNFKVIKTLTIDPDNDIRNIILLKTIDDIMIAASPNKLVVLNEGKFLTKEFFIQSYLVDDSYIYIATLDGRLIKYDLKLKKLASKKFKFAKIHGIAIDKEKNIYGVEAAGYLIKVSADFSKITIYDFPIESDEMMYIHKSKIYFENKVLDLDLK